MMKRVLKHSALIFALAFGWVGSADAQSARYWRLDMNWGTPGINAGIAELELRSSIGGSDLTGSGTASASSTAAPYVASRAFDNNITINQVWISSTTNAEWLQYDFGSGNAHDIIEIVLTARVDSPVTAPIYGRLLYSTDGTNFTPYWYFTTTNDWGSNEARTFSKSETYNMSGGHRYWRFNVTSNGGGANYEIGNISVKTAPSGLNLSRMGSVTASSEANSLVLAIFAIDENNVTKWAAVDAAGTEYITWDAGYGNAPAVTQFEVTHATDQPATFAPTAGSIQWSDNGTDWTTDGTYTGCSWSSGETKTFYVGGTGCGVPPVSGGGSRSTIFGANENFPGWFNDENRCKRAA